MKTAACLLLLGVAVGGAALPAPLYDLLLKGGHVIDSKSGLSAVRDVAIAGGKVAAIAPGIARSEARKTIDVSGLYVTPGLVDIHAHVYAGAGSAYTGRLSVLPDGFTLRAGVTTVVDAGGSGWRNFAHFKATVIDRQRTRVLALVNIVGHGMDTVHEQNAGDMNPRKTAELVRRYPGIVVGIKTAHYRGPEWTAVDRAVEAGRLADVPVMVDFGEFRAERPFEDLVRKHLRPGDIYTHLYLSFVPMLDEQRRIRPFLFEARRRGVIFDVGHGGGSFVWRLAAPALEQGFGPDSISTDLHVGSMNGSMQDMVTVMSKFLNLGMTMEQVIRASTWAPAREIRRLDLGQLSVGAKADIAVLELKWGDFGYSDTYGAALKGRLRLAADMTFREGKLVWDANGRAREDWKKLGEYLPQGDSAWDGVIPDVLRKRTK
jgi:dihydroorotase